MEDSKDMYMLRTNLKPTTCHPDGYKAGQPILKPSGCAQSRPILKLSGQSPDSFKTVQPDEIKGHKKAVTQAARVRGSRAKLRNRAHYVKLGPRSTKDGQFKGATMRGWLENHR